MFVFVSGIPFYSDKLSRILCLCFFSFQNQASFVVLNEFLYPSAQSFMSSTDGHCVQRPAKLLNIVFIAYLEFESVASRFEAVGLILNMKSLLP